MGTLYFCGTENRRRLVGAKPPKLNGIDYLEVQADQTKLAVHFLHPFDATKKLTADNIVIEGGVRLRGIKVTKVEISPDEHGVLDVLTISVNAPGDFSTYTLRLVKSATNSASAPDGFDPQLSAVDFSFKVDCPSDFDCAPEGNCPPEVLPEPEIDYLAKDFNSFTRLMLDRLSILTPGWQERNPADLQVALVEMLAYVGDHLSYYQDAVATEAYLGSARKRISVRRHARLLDYFMHDGCNARAWVAFTVKKGSRADGLTLTAGKNPLLSGPVSQSALVDPDPGNLARVLNEGPVVFETMMDVTLYESHNEIEFYTWSDTNCCLPRGSTRATLKNDPALYLAENDFLLFEEVLSPTTGLPADADPTHRQVVRLTKAEHTTDPLLEDVNGQMIEHKVVNIEWAAADALTFPLCLSATIIDKNDQPKEYRNVSVARGNVTLADHGLTFFKEPKELVPPKVPRRGAYRPHLEAGPLTYQGVFYDSPDKTTQLKPPAATYMRWDVRDARPTVKLTEKSANGAPQIWMASPQADLLSSDQFAREFVVELESDGIASFRFGDDAHARKPIPDENDDLDTRFAASYYRVGNGAAGNIGAEVLQRIVIGANGGGIIGVRNPLPAWGGVDPEALETARLYAPQAFRKQERAVTVADYAEVTERHPEVQKAAATLCWTGSWYTMFITIDRVGGRSVDDSFEQEIRKFVERYRLAGYDVEINAPLFVPLEIVMRVCVKPGYFRSNVKKALQQAFSNRDLPDNRRGFFHPDHFTFAQPVYTSRIYQTALSIDGVQSLEITRFQRLGKLPNQELENGALTPGRLEIIRLDNDPNFAENGKIEFEMHGGI